MELEISGFGTVLLYIVGALLFLAGGLLTAKLVRPNRPNAEKLTTYECGEDPVGTAWGQFNFRFYIIALIFVLFDVEIVFLFPWSTVLGSETLIKATDGAWGWFALIEMAIFLAILALGLAYVWANGMLDWVRPTVKKPAITSPVPPSLYEAFNQRMRGTQVSTIEDSELGI